MMDRGNELDECIDRLFAAGDLVVTDDVELELVRQRRSLAALDAKATRGTATSRYLATYDGLMRVVEIACVHRGYRFGSHPHRAMKAIVLAACDDSNVDAAVSHRHDVKKTGAPVDEATFQLLERLRGSFDLRA